MKKHVSICAVLLIICVVITTYITNQGQENLINPKGQWTIEGDANAFSDINLSYEVYGNHTREHWTITSAAGKEDTVLFAKEEVDIDEIYKQNSFANVDQITGSDNIKETLDRKSFFKSLYNQMEAAGELEKEFDPVKINSIVENYVVEVTLQSGVHAPGYNKEYYTLFPIGDEVTFVPYVKGYPNEDGRVEYTGVMTKESYCFYADAYVIGEKAYMVVEGKAQDEQVKKESFTDIYLISNDLHTLLEEPVLVKHFDTFQAIVEMGMAGDTPYFIANGMDNRSLAIFDQDSFEIQEVYELPYRKSSLDYECWVGLSYYYTNHLRREVLCVKNGNLYMLDCFSTSSDNESKAREWFEIHAYEPGNMEAIASARIDNSLFTMEMENLRIWNAEYYLYNFKIQ